MWLVSLAVGVVLPLLSRVLGYGSLAATWQATLAEHDAAAGGGGGWWLALQLAMHAFTALLTMWEVLVLCCFLLLSVVDLQRLACAMELLRVALLRPFEMCTASTADRRACQQRPLRIDVSLGTNAAAWVDVRATFLHLGSGFRVRTAAYMAMTLLLNAVLLGLLILSAVTRTVGGPPGGLRPAAAAAAASADSGAQLHAQRTSLLQMLTATVSFSVISVIVALVVQGERVNSSFMGHKFALVKRQLEVRERAHDECFLAFLLTRANSSTRSTLTSLLVINQVRERAGELRFRDLASGAATGAAPHTLAPLSRRDDMAVARLELADTIIAGVVARLEMQAQVEPIRLFGLPVGNWMLTSSAVGFVTTAAAIVQALTADGGAET
jgi:hypothetical protein